MHTPDHDDDGGDALFDRVGLVRGLLVIVTAVAVGGFVLARGIGPGSEIAAGPGDPDAATPVTTVDPVTSGDLTTVPAEETAGATATTLVGGGAEDTAGGGPQEGTPQPDVAAPGAAGSAGVLTGPGDITVLVLNGAGTKGIAARGTAVLDEIGYDTLAPKNATTLGVTQVLYAPGSEAAASEVAAAFELDPPTVVAPLDVSSPPIDDTQSAQVIVVIGQDGLIDP